MAKAGVSFDTVAKRGRLASQRNPYWAGVSGGRGGVSLGYRKPTRGPGTWVGKLVIDGARREEKLGEADDAGASGAALDYPKAVTAALTWARQAFASIEAQSSGQREAAAPTVRSAVEAYIADRKLRSQHGRDASSRLTKHVLGVAWFADTKLSRLTMVAFGKWRATLPDGHKPSTINRLLNDLRAALNAAADLHRREMPAHLAADIRAGTKAISGATEARRQILSDADVRKLIEHAFAVDADGDFGRLVLLMAATGARFSQLAGMTVADVQPVAARAMVPTSAKGRGPQKAGRTAVPVGADVIDGLRPVLVGRAGHEPLLMRWIKRQTGPFAWERAGRAAWKSASEPERMWSRTIEAAGLPADTVMYALRHSSIVRGLRSGLPVRLVAALHNTSMAMIEKHYAAFIVDATEELARRSLVSLAPTAPVAEAAE